MSEEEENYVRMGLLLTGVSPRAVRTLFDEQFHPSDLNLILKRGYNKLLELKSKKKINESHWSLLFPECGKNSKFLYKEMLHIKKQALVLIYLRKTENRSLVSLCDEC